MTNNHAFDPAPMQAASHTPIDVLRFDAYFDTNVKELRRVTPQKLVIEVREPKPI